jgi:hypothetical protein
LNTVEWTEGPAARPASRSRRWLVAVVVAVALVAAGAIAATRQFGRSAPTSSASQAALSTATVKRMDLAQTTPVHGTVGYASPHTIVQPAGTGPQAITQAQQSVAQAQGNLTADQKSLGDTNLSDAQSVTQAGQTLATAQATLASDRTQLQADQATLAGAEQKEANDCQGGGSAGSAPAGTGPSGAGGSGGSPPCATDTSQVATHQETVGSDQQKVTSDQVAVQSGQGQVTSAEQKQAQGNDQGRAKVAADRLALSNAESAVSTAEAAAAAYDPTSKYTALPAVGQVIDLGQSLWSVDGRQVPLLTGTLVAWRAFTAGMPAGSDVAALDQALIDLGLGGGLTVSEAFSDATAAAIDRFQASLACPRPAAWRSARRSSSRPRCASPPSTRWWAARWAAASRCLTSPRPPQSSTSLFRSTRPISSSSATRYRSTFRTARPGKGRSPRSARWPPTPRRPTAATTTPRPR